MVNGLSICVSDKNNFTYEDSGLGQNRCGKLILIVLDVTKSMTSMHIAFLVQSSGQRSSSLLMTFTSPAMNENSWFEIFIRL